MLGFVERNQENRRQKPIRSGQERRRAGIPIPAGVTRSGRDRRTQDRRNGVDRRMAGPNSSAAD